MNTNPPAHSAATTKPIILCFLSLRRQGDAASLLRSGALHGHNLRPFYEGRARRNVKKCEADPLWPVVQSHSGPSCNFSRTTAGQARFMATFVEFVPTLRDSEPACEFNERLLYAPP